MQDDPQLYAILSDIHGNIEALNAVLADLAPWPVKSFVCLGDIIGYGPDPALCVQSMMDKSSVCVFGNHEAFLFISDRLPPEQIGPTVGIPIRLAINQLNDPQRDWLKTCPITATLGTMTLSHASLSVPESFHYLLDEQIAAAHFRHQSTFVSFQGHTHVPATWEDHHGEIACYHPLEEPVQLDEESRYAINVGSVGQPRDADPRASYALYDEQNRILFHRRVEYDIDAAIARFKDARMPAHNYERLLKGK